MAWTQSDLTQLNEAIIALATGKRVVSVTVDGQTTQYAATDLDKLKTLRDEMQAEIGTAYPRPIRIRPGRTR